MVNNDIYNFVGDKLNEMFWEVLKENSIESGDIMPDEAMRLEQIQNNITDIIIKVVDYNRGH